MAQYRFYCFSARPQLPGVSRSVVSVESFDAPNDDEALITAWTIRRRRRDQRYGYEVWQRDRLVFRHPPAETGRPRNASPNPEEMPIP